MAQETRLYDADKDETRSMRSKEEANDYRYFPDPDLLPLEIEHDFIADVKNSLPELPDQKKQRFISDYELTPYEAGVLTASRELASFYEGVVKTAQGEAKLAANWVTGELLGALNKAGLDILASPVTARALGAMLLRIKDNTISGKIAKQVFEAMWQGEGDADAIIEAKGLRQVTDSGAIEKVVDEVIANSPQQLEQYRAGKEALFGYFVGQAMKASQGKANPAQVNALLKEKLK